MPQACHKMFYYWHRRAVSSYTASYRNSGNCCPKAKGLYMKGLSDRLLHEKKIIRCKDIDTIFMIVTKMSSPSMITEILKKILSHITLTVEKCLTQVKVLF